MICYKIARWVRLELLALQFGMFQAFAYIASHVDGQPDFQKHESAAGEAYRLWHREMIQ